MTELSKQQLILLALLVSFVTSLATGIVTVSLMDQAPQGITRTVSQVIEKTIQQIAPQNASVAAAPATLADQTAEAVQKVSESVVRLENKDGSNVGGLGLIVSKEGVIISDKAAIAGLTNYSAMQPDGSVVNVSVVRSQIDGDVVFLAPLPSALSGTVYVPIEFAKPPELGQTVFSLTGTSTSVLGQGIITQTMERLASTTSAAPIMTSIPPSKVIAGSPLFDLSGKIIGMRTSSLDTRDGAEFYPISQLRSVIPKIK
jgi:hypothetical protein